MESSRVSCSSTDTEQQQQQQQQQLQQENSYCSADSRISDCRISGDGGSSSELEASCNPADDAVVSDDADDDDDDDDDDDRTVGVGDVPDEILTLILSHTSAYRDYGAIRRVCWRWRNIIHEVSRRRNKLFRQAVANSTLNWRYHEQPVGMATVTERYSHSACYYDKSVYVFGGCASTSTTFNDLWRFDLAQQIWIRPLASGSYPSPKACASFLAYQDSLVLFGGWSHPNNYSFFQESKFFNQLHLYHPATSKWTKVEDPLGAVPKERAGHGASIINHHMIVIGGYQGIGTSTSSSSVDVWLLDLKRMTWASQSTSGPEPSSRYAHSQAVLDDGHIVIVGGCAGPNRQLSDAWLLTLDLDSKAESWTWVELKVCNPENSVPKLMSHPACQVGSTLIALNKNPKVVRSALSSADRTRSSRCLCSTGCLNQSAASLQHASQSAASLQSRCEYCLGSKRCHPATDTSDSSSDNDDSGFLRRAAWCQQRRGSAARQRGARDMRGEGTTKGLSGEVMASLDDTLRDDELRLLEEEEDDEIRTAVCSTATTALDTTAAAAGAATTAVNTTSAAVAATTAVDTTAAAASSTAVCFTPVPHSSTRQHTNIAPNLDSSTSIRPSNVSPDLDPSASTRPDLDPSASTRPDLDHSIIPRMQSVTLPGRGTRPAPISSQRPTSVSRNRQKQLEALRHHAEKLALRTPPPPPGIPPPRPNPPPIILHHRLPPMAAFAVDAGNQTVGPVEAHRCCLRGQGCSSTIVRRLPPLNPMYVHRLDLSSAITEATVAWLPVEAGPETGEEPADETMFYSLVEGRGELIMFGGIQGDSVSMQKTLNQSKSVTRDLFYIQAAPNTAR